MLIDSGEFLDPAGCTSRSMVVFKLIRARTRRSVRDREAEKST